MRDLEPRVVELFGKGSWMHTTVLARVGEFELARGNVDAARGIFNRLVTDYAEVPGAMTTNRAAGREGLVRVALADNDVPRARELAVKLVEDIEGSKGRGELPDQEAGAHLLLGVALLRAGDAASARAELERALGMRESMDAPESLWLAEVRLYFAQALQALGDSPGARRQVSLAEAAHRAQAHVGPQYSSLLAATRTRVR